MAVVQLQPSSSYCSTRRASSCLPSFSSLSSIPSSPLSLLFISNNAKKHAFIPSLSTSGTTRRLVVRSSTGSLGSRPEEWWKPKGLPATAPSLSDVIWPSAGAFAAMALLGRLDQMVAPRGLSFTIASLGAVCAVLFATPDSPAAQKYNMFVAQIGCAAFGVLALSVFGPGWLARGTALAASVAFMIITGATHPPAASLPILFIDGSKFHSLHLWYALFPGATGCLLLCLIQEMVRYLKNNWKF